MSICMALIALIYMACVGGGHVLSNEIEERFYVSNHQIGVSVFDILHSDSITQLNLTAVFLPPFS